jgi:hypothetical protein
MPDQTPQWPYMPAIQGQVPLPHADPRSKMMQALMSKPPTPMPRSDPRDWTTRAIAPKVQTQEEYNTPGAIDPDALMRSRGGGAFTPPANIDPNTYMQPGVDAILHNNAYGSQRPMGFPSPMQQQDVINLLRGNNPNG